MAAAAAATASGLPGLPTATPTSTSAGMTWSNHSTLSTAQAAGSGGAGPVGSSRESIGMVRKRPSVGISEGKRTTTVSLTVYRFKLCPAYPLFNIN